MFPTKTFAREEIIFKEGQPSDVAYIIKSGQVEISKLRQDKKIILNILKPPEIFGEMAFINKEPRSATAKALEYAELIVVNHDQLEDFLEKSPLLVRALVRGLAKRLKITTSYVRGRASDNAFLSVCHILSLIYSAHPGGNQEGSDASGLEYETVASIVKDTLPLSSHDLDVVLEKLYSLNLVQIRQEVDKQVIEINEPQTFLDRAKRFYDEWKDKFSELRQENAYIDVQDLARMLKTEPDLIRQKMTSGAIPESFLFFHKDDVLKWAQEKGEDLFHTDADPQEQPK
jgi:CRP-like cAMP-binding protein